MTFVVRIHMLCRRMQQQNRKAARGCRQTARFAAKTECRSQLSKRRDEEAALSKPDVYPLRSSRLHCAKTAWAKMQQYDQCRGVLTHRSAQVERLRGEPTGQDSSRVLLKVTLQFQMAWTHHTSVLPPRPLIVWKSDKGHRVPRGCAMVDGSSVVFDDLWNGRLAKFWIQAA